MDRRGIRGFFKEPRSWRGWAIGLLWVLSVVLLWPAHGMLLNVDEVDYVRAARLGVLVNAFDRRSLSPGEFVRLVEAKFHGRSPAFSENYDEARDPVVLRHYHPPLVVVMLSPLSRFQDERVLRIVQVAGAMALAAVIVSTYGSLVEVPMWPEVIILMALVLQLVGVGFATISFHGWEAVWSTVTAALLSLWLDKRKRAIGGLLCLSAGAALVTLESGVVVVVGAALCLLWWAGGRWRDSYGRVVMSFLGLTLLFAFVMWPGAVLKMSLIKPIANHVYRQWTGEDVGIFRLEQLSVLEASGPLLALTALSCAFLVWKCRTELRKWGPFLMIAGLYGISVVWFATGPVVMTPAMGPLVCFIGFALHRAREFVGSYGRVGLVGMAVLSVLLTLSPGVENDQGRREDIFWLRNFLDGREALADLGQMYEYYLGADYAIRTVTVPRDGKSLLLRERGAYRPLQREELHGKVILIQKGREYFFDGPVAKTLLVQCAQVERLTMRAYDCSEGIQ